MEATKYTIKAQFLSEHKYHQLFQHTYTYETLFKTWLNQIMQNYRGSQRPQSIVLSREDTSIELTKQGLHNLIYPFIIKLYDISNQHLTYVGTIMRQSASVSLERDFERVRDRVNKLNECQQQFQTQYRDLLSSENRIVLNPTHNIQFYYYSNWFKRLSALEKYAKSTQALIENKPDKGKIYLLSESVQEELLQLRKKIMDYKYGYLKQGVKISRQLLKCLSQYLTIGMHILTKINGKIKLQMASDNQNLRGLRYSSSFGSETDHMLEFRENYQSKSEAFRNTLTDIQSLFIFGSNIVEKKQLFQRFERAYSGNEHLLAEMFDTYNLFEAMSERRKIMNQKVSIILRVIEDQYKSKKKAVEIISTLNKRKSLEESRSLENSRSIHHHQFDVANILKSISDAIEFALKSFSQMSQLCYKASSRATEQKFVENDVQVSYQYKQIRPKNKRPSHQQIWLWKDWREFKAFEEVTPKFSEKVVAKELYQIKKIMQEADEDGQKISCQIEGRNSGKATMQITSEKVQVTSKKDGAANFILPFKFIDYVEPHKKKLIIKMNGGAQLKLSDFKNVTQVQRRINEFFLSKPDQANEQGSLIPAKPAITITPQQLEAIQKRASQMDKIKPNLKDYTVFSKTFIKEITMQEVYENIFSDKNSCLLDKNMSFFAYTNIKNGNYNITGSKYDNPGPYFYTTQNKDITFVNCSLQAKKFTQFDHPLPPIPFLPKSTHCKSEQTIFWISNKQFQFNNDVRSYGSKMMQSFFTTSLYVVKQEADGVSVQFLYKVEFKKDATMKSILLNGVKGEIKTLVPSLMKEFERCCRMAVKARARQGTGNQNLIDQNDLKQKQQDEKLKNKAEDDLKGQTKINRTIIFLVIGTILVNILINIIL